MATSVVPCVCRSDVCVHKNGEQCGKPVTVKLKMSVALGGGQFSEEYETGICEECWDTIKQHYPELFPWPAKK